MKGKKTMIDFDRNFPRYTEGSPEVPIWSLTQHSRHLIHRFFDTKPLSPSGRYLAVFQLPDQDCVPQPGDRGNVVLVDLQTGEERIVWETAGWEYQMGANINCIERVALVSGVDSFKPACVTATDLRAGAALVCAALEAPGVSYIGYASRIDRGYENIIEKLTSLGADIERVEKPVFDNDGEP